MQESGAGFFRAVRHDPILAFHMLGQGVVQDAGIFGGDVEKRRARKDSVIQDNDKPLTGRCLIGALLTMRRISRP